MTLLTNPARYVDIKSGLALNMLHAFSLTLKSNGSEYYKNDLTQNPACYVDIKSGFA